MSLFKQNKPTTFCPFCEGIGFQFGSECLPCKGIGHLNSCSKCKNTGIQYDSYYGNSYCSCKFGDYQTQLDSLKLTIKKAELTNPYKLNNDKEGLEAKSKKYDKDLEIVPAQTNQIQIDYDYDEIPKQFDDILFLLRERFPKGNLIWNKFRSASGKHWHVIIDLPEPISNQERIVWQAVFGSDYRREGLSLLRLIAQLENPSLLYMEKNKVAIETHIVPEKPIRKFKELEKV